MTTSSAEDYFYTFLFYLMPLPNISKAPINLAVVIPNDLYYDNTVSTTVGSVMLTEILLENTNTSKKKRERLRKK